MNTACQSISNFNMFVTVSLFQKDRGERAIGGYSLIVCFNWVPIPAAATGNLVQVVYTLSENDLFFEENLGA